MKRELKSFKTSGRTDYEAGYAEKGFSMKNPTVTPYAFRIAAHANQGFVYRKNLRALAKGMDAHYRTHRSLELPGLFADEDFFNFCIRALKSGAKRVKIPRAEWINALVEMIPDKPTLYINGMYLTEAIRKGAMPPMNAIPVWERNRVFRSLKSKATDVGGKFEIVDGEIVGFDLKDDALNRYIWDNKEKFEALLKTRANFGKDGKVRYALSPNEDGNYAAYKGKFSEIAQKLVFEIANGEVSKKTFADYGIAKQQPVVLFGQEPDEYKIFKSKEYKIFIGGLKRGIYKPPYELRRMAQTMIERNPLLVIDGSGLEKAIINGSIEKFCDDFNRYDWAEVARGLGKIAYNHRQQDPEKPPLELEKSVEVAATPAAEKWVPQKAKKWARLAHRHTHKNPKIPEEKSKKENLLPPVQRTKFDGKHTYNVVKLIQSGWRRKTIIDFRKGLTTFEFWRDPKFDAFFYSKGELIDWYFANQSIRTWIKKHLNDIVGGVEVLYEYNVIDNEFTTPESTDNRDDAPQIDYGEEELRGLDEFERFIPDELESFVQRRLEDLLEESEKLTPEELMDRAKRVAERPYFIGAKALHVLGAVIGSGQELPDAPTDEIIGYLNPSVLHYIEEARQISWMAPNPTLANTHRAIKKFCGNFLDTGTVPSPTLRSTLRTLDNLAKDDAYYCEAGRKFDKQYQESSAVRHWGYFNMGLARALFGGTENYTIDEPDEGARPRESFLAPLPLLVPGTPVYDEFVCGLTREEDGLGYAEFVKIALRNAGKSELIEEVLGYIYSVDEFEPSCDGDDSPYPDLFNGILSDEEYEKFLWEPGTFSAGLQSIVDAENRARKEYNSRMLAARKALDELDKKAVFDFMVKSNEEYDARQKMKKQKVRELLSQKDLHKKFISLQ